MLTALSARCRRIVSGPRSIIGVMVLAVVSALYVVATSSGTTGNAGLIPEWILTWWLRLLAGVAALQLAAAVIHLAVRDIRRATRVRGPASADFATVADAQTLAEALRKAFYVRVRRSPGADRFVKNAWGYAGPSVFHAGMLVVLVGALLASLTASTGVLRLFEGETVLAGTPLDSADRGPLGDPPELDATLRLERLDIRYWPDGSPRTITGSLGVSDSGPEQMVEVAVNSPVTVNGVRIFQDPRVGYAYGMTITYADGGTQRLRLDMPLPEMPDEPTYQDVTLSNGDLLQAKLSHDPSIPGGAPVLTLRVVRDDRILGQHEFTDLSRAQLGDVDVSVEATSLWSVIALERTHGTGMVFAGFFMIFGGVALMYAFTPREITITKGKDGSLLAEWHAVRFRALYVSEWHRLSDAVSTNRASE